jgi:hypothetical protein
VVVVEAGVAVAVSGCRGVDSECAQEAELEAEAERASAIGSPEDLR